MFEAIKLLELHEMEGTAARVATKAHDGQTRWDKSVPYITHPSAVADMFKDSLGERGVHLRTSAWLHDVVEDTDVTMQDIQKEFGYFVEKGVGDKMYWFLQNKQLDLLESVQRKKPTYGFLSLPETT